MALDASGSGTTSRSGSPATAWVARLLRTPLLAKVVLLDLVIDVLVLSVMQVTPPEYDTAVTAVSLAFVLVVNAGLVAWALAPLRRLEETALRVSEGQFEARVGPSRWGVDVHVARIGRTFDELLDRVAADRTRVRRLAQQVVAAGEQERARIGRELHDGTAQSLSALDMLLSRLLAEAADGPLAPRIQQLREVVADALVEVRALAQTVHPRVLDDLGLPAALETLARRARAQTSAAIEVRCEGSPALPADVAAALWRVAQEAVHNAVKHARASRIEVALVVEGGVAALTVTDDGVGLARPGHDDGPRGMGLFVMEERIMLVDGRFAVEARPGGGTVVRAVVPLAGREGA
jgi:signal transduction histidine kinase